MGSNKKLEVFVCPIQDSTYLNNACLIIKCALTTKSKEAWMEVKRKQSSTRFRIHGQSQWNQYWYLCKWIRNNNTIHYAQCFRIKKRIVPLPVSSYHYFVRFSARNSVGLGGFDVANPESVEAVITPPQPPHRVYAEAFMSNRSIGSEGIIWRKSYLAL